jgi:hypothetical protein
VIISGGSGVGVSVDDERVTMGAAVGSAAAVGAGGVSNDAGVATAVVVESDDIPAQATADSARTITVSARRKEDFISEVQ